MNTKHYYINHYYFNKQIKVRPVSCNNAKIGHSNNINPAWLHSEFHLK